MEQLIDFLNHGILPFTGRREEVERIVGFWRGTFTAQELRAALVIGEAGLGKSRLIAESIPLIAQAGGTVIHTRLYPESATSAVPLIAQDLWYSRDVRGLLKTEPEPSVPDVVAALRRISRLRPTLVVIEDIHLMSGEALREFSLLLNALAEETLSLLCAARPVELGARAPLERFIIDEIQLTGLSSLDIEALWTQLLRTPPEPEILRPLAELTGGNPLALRSALRGAIKNETLAYDAAANTWRSTISPEAFGAMLKRNVGRMAEGMVAHLTDREREVAETIAMLGEIFARVSAHVLIENATAMLDTLIFKGIIATSDTATPPLPGESSESPLLAFTHSLLHQHLLDSSRGSRKRLAALVASGAPIYSIVPLQVLERSIAALEMGGDELEMLIRRIADIASHIRHRPLWHQASDILAIAASIFQTFRDRWSDEEQSEMQALLLNAELDLRVRSFDTPEFLTLVERQIALTSDPRSERMALFHLWGLRFLYQNVALRSYESCAGIWERAEGLLEGFPGLRNTLAYINLLRDVAQSALRIPDLKMLRLVEMRLQSLLASEELDEEMRAEARVLVATQFLQLFDTEEELARRLQVLRDLPRSAFDRDPTLLLRKIELFGNTGRIDEVLAVPADTLQSFLDRGLLRSAFHFSIIRLCAEGGAGADLPALERKVHDVEKIVRSKAAHDSEVAASMFFRNAAIYLSEIGALRGDLEWTRRIMAELAPGEPCYWPEVEILFAVEEGRLAEAAGKIPTEESFHQSLAILARFASRDASVDAAQAGEHARSLLFRPILGLDDLLVLHASAALVDAIATGARELPGIESTLGHGFVRGLTWLAEHSIASYMAPLIERYKGYFTKRDLAHWRGMVREIERRRESVTSMEEGRTKIRMLGTIGHGEPGRELQPLRGARARTVLGLLVATRMLPEPLSSGEFNRIAAGGELDQDLARKTSSMAMMRLRETVGQDLIVSRGEEGYELNLDRAQVDLLDAHTLLLEASEAIRNRMPMRSYPALLKVLDLTDGEVPFPGLYDDLFEALRDDFESTLRSTIVALTTYLVRENDPESAERLLRRSFDAMPEDEEIGALLRQALLALGRRAEAERIRMKAYELEKI